MKKRSFIVISVLILLLTSFFVSNQFIVMPWENSLLPKLENPRLVVKKSERKLYVFDSEKLIKTYEIVLGFMPVGDKEIEGDGKTPEGEFYVLRKMTKANFICPWV